MTTREFVDKYGSYLSDTMLERISRIQEMEEVWDTVSIPTRINFLSLTGISNNLQFVYGIVYREMVFSCLGQINSNWAKDKISQHLSFVNKSIASGNPLESASNAMNLIKFADTKKFKLHDTHTYNLLYCFPVSFEKWVLKGNSFCYNFNAENTEKLFDMWIKNPFVKVKNA